ncbi:MAG: hypothetical protein J5925_00535 [Clostridia bacterium]|nr:hypothetical protein [Clostridia bacterium]
MKRILAVILLAVFALGALAACNGGDGTESSQQEEISQEESVMGPDKNAEALWKPEYADEQSGLASAQDIYKLTAYANGAVTDGAAAINAENDNRFLFAGEEYTRAVVLPEGYAVTLPANDITADFSLGKLRSKYTSESAGFTLTLTYENQNPYANQGEKGWETYYDEWLTRRIASTDFLSKNSVRRTRKIGETDELLPGYTVYYFDMVISINAKIDMPYYSIAVVRPRGSVKKFWLFVLKSREQMTEAMDAIVASFVEIDKSGTAVNSVGAYELKIPENWNAETREYYESLLNSNTVQLGAFYEKNDPNYRAWLEGEEGINQTFDFYMTYNHVGWYGNKTDIDTKLINTQAGGDGKNGLPMLELTYQFTDTNNNLDAGQTPMFDILRGRYDAHFRKLAQDIKAYGHPVLFRLNNEMNTDWTSYCGMMTMLDPDIFIETWRRIYNIFLEEGVDNCIWVWNPIATSCPYSNWGDMLNYFPGPEYVQMLGLTYYQMNNGKTENFTSFKNMYTELYKKNTPYFDNYPAVIGEFGCASGGDYVYSYSKGTYVEADNIETRRKQQADWITGMFECFLHKNEPGYEFCKNICVAIWFSANDYADFNGTTVITNHLKLDDSNPLALKAFHDGYQKLKDARK